MGNFQVTVGDSTVSVDDMSREQIKELITRRRRQVWVHSIIYYRLDRNVIDDSKWSRWALELEELQKYYPDLAAECPYADVFEGFDHSTGSNLPLDDKDMTIQAWWVIRADEEFKKNSKN